jgi:UDP-N-acetylmuramoyl-tripeptide--D-alanyl-D-alanine ligase
VHRRLPAWRLALRFRRYQPRDIPGLLRTPVGRRELRQVLLHYLWPVTSRLARLYRSVVLDRVHVVAVTGSYGKTTAARAILAALGQARREVHKNARSYIPGAICAIRREDRTAVIEVGIDGPGQMAAIARTLRPDIAVVTCIGSEHNRSFGSLENTREEKAHMVRALPGSGLAVLNGDDPNVLWMAAQTRARVVTFGFHPSNQVRASDPRLDWPHGTRFRLHAAGGEREVRIRLLGRHMVYPVLAAVAVALSEGQTLDDILRRLADLGPTPGRLAPSRLENGVTLLCDDLKSGLETIHAALDVLADIPAPRKMVVLGPITEPVGNQGAHYRSLGARIARIAQVAVLVGSHKEYRGGLHRAGMPRQAVWDAGCGIAWAVEFLRRELRPGDVVLIKGRNAQKLERIALALEGTPVRCTLESCRVLAAQCRSCPMLGRGW